MRLFLIFFGLYFLSGFYAGAQKSQLTTLDNGFTLIHSKNKARIVIRNPAFQSMHKNALVHLYRNWILNILLTYNVRVKGITDQQAISSIEIEYTDIKHLVESINHLWNNVNINPIQFAQLKSQALDYIADPSYTRLMERETLTWGNDVYKQSNATDTNHIQAIRIKDFNNYYDVFFSPNNFLFALDSSIDIDILAKHLRTISSSNYGVFLSQYNPIFIQGILSSNQLIVQNSAISSPQLVFRYLSSKIRDTNDFTIQQLWLNAANQYFKKQKIDASAYQYIYNKCSVIDIQYQISPNKDICQAIDTIKNIQKAISHTILQPAKEVSYSSTLSAIDQWQMNIPLNKKNKLISDDISDISKFSDKYLTNKNFLLSLYLPQGTSSPSCFQKVSNKDIEYIFIPFQKNSMYIDSLHHNEKLSKLAQWLKLNPKSYVLINGLASKKEYLKVYDQDIDTYIRSLPYTLNHKRFIRSKKSFIRLDQMRLFKVMKYLSDHQTPFHQMRSAHNVSAQEEKEKSQGVSISLIELH